MIANYKPNPSFCYRAFITSFKQFLINSLKLEVTLTEAYLRPYQTSVMDLLRKWFTAKCKRKPEINAPEKNKGSH